MAHGTMGSGKGNVCVQGETGERGWMPELTAGRSKLQLSFAKASEKSVCEEEGVKGVMQGGRPVFSPSLSLLEGWCHLAEKGVILQLISAL